MTTGRPRAITRGVLRWFSMNWPMLGFSWWPECLVLRSLWELRKMFQWSGVSVMPWSFQDNFSLESVCPQCQCHDRAQLAARASVFAS